MDQKVLAPFSTLSEYQLHFLEALSRNRVRCVVIGGYAMRYFGCNRSAKDLDLLVGHDLHNGRRLLAALKEVGGVTLDEARQVLRKPKFQVRWRDVEMLTSIDGLEFDAVVSRAVTALIQNTNQLIASKEDLLTSKLVAAREEDKCDIAFLRGETRVV